jgi:hypothetical protein
MEKLVIFLSCLVTGGPMIYFVNWSLLIVSAVNTNLRFFSSSQCIYVLWVATNFSKVPAMSVFKVKVLTLKNGSPHTWVNTCHTTVTGYGLYGRGSIPDKGKIFLFSIASRPVI